MLEDFLNGCNFLNIVSWASRFVLDPGRNKHSRFRGFFGPRSPTIHLELVFLLTENEYLFDNVTSKRTLITSISYQQINNLNSVDPDHATCC